jgi:acetyl esterase/lipase
LASRCCEHTLSFVLNLIRPSRIVAIAIIVAVPMFCAHWRAVVYGAINVPSYVGFYKRYASISYGDQPLQSLDVYAPSGAVDRPIVVFWHGGVWQEGIGSKEQYRFVGAALANSGYVAVLPDYRLWPKARFPQFIDDGALAVKWARDHARELGGDPQSIFLMGHSAGGHLAATVALDPRYLEKAGVDSKSIRGWIAISTPYELKWIIPWMYLMFNAHDPTEWRPISLVSDRAPPALLVHGLEDPAIHPREVLHMEAKLRAAHVPVECRIYDAGHIATILSFSPVFRFEASTLADVQRFIDRTLHPKPNSSPSDACPDVSGRRSWNWENPLIARPDLMEVQ